MAENLVIVGKVVRPHGIRGELKVQSFTEETETLSRFPRIYLGKPGRMPSLRTVVECRPHQSGVLLRLEGVGNRNQAEDLVGSEISVERDWLPEADEGEYYIRDLIGLTAFDSEGRPLGRVVNVQQTPGHDLLVLDIGGREVLVPFVEAMVPEVDMEAGRILVTPPDGLLDL